MSKEFSIHVAVLCFCCIGVVQADSPTRAFILGSIEAQAGTSVSGYLEVPPGVDQAARIPVSVIHGARPGPTLALVAGTHGYEYPPITALQRLRGALDPAKLSGTIPGVSGQARRND